MLVIEQYESRFVHVESRLTMVEQTVTRSGNMLAKLLRHNNGIAIEEDENMEAIGGRMEIEPPAPMGSGTKRICSTTNRELAHPETPNSHHA